MNWYGSLRKSQFKSISSRLAVKSLINSKFDFESTVPGKTNPTRLWVLKSTQVDLLGSTPRSNSTTTDSSSLRWSFWFRLPTELSLFWTHSMVHLITCSQWWTGPPGHREKWAARVGHILAAWAACTLQ